jgi:[ribosomal protein S5]-alanine N-acetyltransferase
MQRLRADHESAVLDFERANRKYFAESISDRGDDFFAHFDDHFRELVAEHVAGVGIYHVLVENDASVVGRFNLYRVENGTAEVGYRVAQRVSGRGVATAGLRNLCRLAREDYGLRTLRAATSIENIASQRVLANAGFTAVGPTEIAGRQGVLYELVLARA